MSQENVEMVRITLDNYCRGDYMAGSAYLAPDVVWHIDQEPPAHGPAEVREVWKRWDADWQAMLLLSRCCGSERRATQDPCPSAAAWREGEASAAGRRRQARGSPPGGVVRLGSTPRWA
jgi:hypothetical protein